MRSMIYQTIFLIAATVSLVGFACPQSVYPVRGGTATEPDPENKKHLVLVAENSTLKITLRHSEKFKPKKGDIWVLWMKIENRSDTPIKFDPTNFNAIDDEGRALNGLEAREAIGRFEDAIAGTMNMVGLIVAGPLYGPSMVKAGERGSNQKLNQLSLQIGDIPPRSFKDGLVYFEKAKSKTKEIKVQFVGIWEEKIVFATDDKQRLKAPTGK